MSGGVQVFTLWPVLLLLPLPGLAAPQPTGSYPHSVVLRDDEQYLLYWKHDTEKIVFEIQVKTKGWVGFGLSPNGGMTGADIFIGWIKDGQAKHHDRHATGTSRPAIDTQQDWTLEIAQETDTHTIFVVSRKLVSCDESPQDLSISFGTNRLIFAWNQNDPGDNGDPDYHGTANRGTKSVQLINPVSNPPPLPSDVITLDMLNPNVSVPSDQDTTYWCQIIELPKLPSKHHLIRYDPIIQPGHEALVHHILVYGCYGQNLTSSVHGFGEQCYVPNMPGNLQACNGVMFAWAIGGGNFYFPSHAGFPFGHADAPEFVRMEMHYDNPQQEAGLVDSSGLRLYLTPTLRSNDAGLLETGMIVDPRLHVVPPKFSNLISRGYCLGDCISQGMGNSVSSINVFASILHSHLLGTAIRVRHIRAGVEQSTLADDPYYDFNFQESRVLNKEITVEKGDTILVECTYKSTDKTQITTAGLGTRDEMCLAYLLYYPAIPLTNCLSGPTQEQALSFAGNGQYTNTYPNYVMTDGQYSGKNFLEVLSGLDWTQQSNRDAYQTSTSGGQFKVRCDRSSFSAYNISNKVVSTPSITTEYKAARGPCDDIPAGGNPLISHNGLVVLTFLSLVMIK